MSRQHEKVGIDVKTTLHPTLKSNILDMIKTWK